MIVILAIIVQFHQLLLNRLLALRELTLLLQEMQLYQNVQCVLLENTAQALLILPPQIVQ